jgi:hypothetical protein
VGLSRLLGILLILLGAVAVIVGVGLFSIPLAVILAGILTVVLGLSLAIEVR